ncbi:hypothetical protein Hte_001926 [Hypoxylon texense]
MDTNRTNYTLMHHSRSASQHETKRRVRKGTRSCWECKRRKMKCTFDPLSASTVCNGCRRRGSKCVSQEFPEDASPSTTATIAVYESAFAMSDGDGRKTDELLTPVSMSPNLSSSAHVQQQHFLEPSKLFKLQFATSTQVSQGDHETLSRYLHSSLPSQADVRRICYAHRHPSVPVLAHEILTLPYTALHQNGFSTPESLLEVPAPGSHPVLLAKHMLQLAIFLQHIHPKNEDLEGLTESPRAIRERLANLAINLITTSDELTGSIEGLACVMMESMYHVNVGNLRRSWAAGRRAIGIAQLMGLDRSDHHARYKTLDPQTRHDAQFMWYRVVFLDRHLSLMLGLPPGSLDQSVASDEKLENDTPTGRLERMQCVIASRILDRNASSRGSSYLDPDQIKLTEALNVELEKAARSLDSKWWRAPNLDNVTSNSSEALFWDTRRLFAQVLHYNLINQLHLPYMLRTSPGAQQQRHDYSRMTCANASREIISRYITLRGFNQIAYSWNCRIVDFLALMAAMTLLLAHLVNRDSHNVLAHQYLTDRAAIEQVQEQMEDVNRLNSDVLSAQSANVLRRLLAIQVDDNVDSSLDFARRVTVHEPGNVAVSHPNTDDDGTTVSAHIPYFGIFKIAGESATQATTTSSQSRLEKNQSPVALDGTDSGYPTTSPSDSVGGDISSSAATESSIWQLYNDILAEHPEEYPDIVAVGEDWAFQGVDMTFLDSLAGGNDFHQDGCNVFT